MKIERIEAIPIRIPLNKVFSGSSYRVDSRATVITRIHAGGLVSEVYNGDDRTHGQEIVRIIEHDLAPLITGQSIHAWERIWQTLFAATIARADRALLMNAI